MLNHDTAWKGLSVVMFEVKATHRVEATGEAACELHPDVFVDEGGRVFVTDEAVAAEAGTTVVSLSAGDGEVVFAVDDDAIEFAVDWINWMSGRPMTWWAMRDRTKQRRAHAAFLTLVRPDFDPTSRNPDTRITRFEVRATHRVKATRTLACEVYPDVFVTKGHRSAISRHAGMAMQQGGDIVDALPDGAQDWFVVDGLETARSWVATLAPMRIDRPHRSERGSDVSEQGPG